MAWTTSDKRLDRDRLSPFLSTSWAASSEFAVRDLVATRGRLLARLGISGMTSSTASSALARFAPYRYNEGSFSNSQSLLRSQTRL